MSKYDEAANEGRASAERDREREARATALLDAVVRQAAEQFSTEGREVAKTLRESGAPTKKLQMSGFWARTPKVWLELGGRWGSNVWLRKDGVWIDRSGKPKALKAEHPASLLKLNDEGTSLAAGQKISLNVTHLYILDGELMYDAVDFEALEKRLAREVQRLVS